VAKAFSTLTEPGLGVIRSAVEDVTMESDMKPDRIKPFFNDGGRCSAASAHGAPRRSPI
jgi:hypothetical protein